MRQPLSQVLKLTVLSLSFSGGIQSGFFPVHAMDAQKIEVLQQNSSIRTLQVNGEELQNEFDGAIKENKTEQEQISIESLFQDKLRPDFERIDLNNLPCRLFEIACDTLKAKSSLTTFCFSLANTVSDKLQESSLESLVQLLQSSSLETAYLILGDNLTIDAAKTLGWLLAEQPITLKRLLLDMGDDPTGEKTIALLDGLENNHTLTQLHLSRLAPLPGSFEMLPLPYVNANVGAKGVARLVSYLASHSNIQSYNLSSTAADGMPNDVLLKALEAIKSHPSLKNIGLRVDQDGEEVDTALTGMVSGNSNLEFVELTSPTSTNEAKKFNLVNLSKQIPISRLKAFNINGFRLSEGALNSLIRGLTDNQSHLRVLQFGGQNLSPEEVTALAGVVELPHSQIEQLTFPFSTIKRFFSGTATAIENMVLKGSLKKLGFEWIELDGESIRKFPEERQVSAFYDAFFQELCRQQQQETLDVVLMWGPPIMGGKKGVSLSPQTLNLMGQTYYNTGAARYIPILFNTFWQEESVPAFVEAWRGIGYFKAGDGVAACQSFVKAFAKDPSLTNPLFSSDTDLSCFLLGTFFDQVNPFIIKSDCYHIIGRAHFIRDQHSEATKWYDKAFRHEDGIVASADRKQFLLEAGQSHLKVGSLNKAVEYFEHIVQKLPNADFLDHTNLGIAYLSQGKERESLEQYEKAIEKNPNASNESYSAAAQVAISLKNWKRAAELYEVVWRRSASPEIVVLANLGTCYLNLENWEKASHHLNKAILFQNDIAVRIYERAAYANAKLWQMEGKSNPLRLERIAIYLFNILDTYQVSISDLMTKELAVPLSEILDISEIKEAVRKLRK